VRCAREELDELVEAAVVRSVERRAAEGAAERTQAGWAAGA
jgi:hypothetical protein